MGFPTTAFNAWLKSQLTTAGWPTGASQATASRNVRFTEDGFIPGHPDRLVTTTPGSGPGFVDEEANVIRHTVQLHVRGRPDDPADAEALMDACDKALIRAVRPVFGSQLCQAVDHAGGPPSAFQPDNRPRYTYICNYVFTIAW